MRQSQRGSSCAGDFRSTNLQTWYNEPIHQFVVIFTTKIFNLYSDHHHAAAASLSAASGNKELNTEGSLYEFSFSADRGRVISESLLKVYPAHEVMLYQRHEGSITFTRMFDAKTRAKLDSIFELTRPNQLFLQSAVMKNHKHFIDAYR